MFNGLMFGFLEMTDYKHKRLSAGMYGNQPSVFSGDPLELRKFFDNLIQTS